MDYVLESSYGMYLLEQISEQQKMERYIRECIILSEGCSVIENIQSLNEGIGDKISEWWEKFKAFINKVWGKFVENFTRFAQADKGYVEKYKDVILKKPLKEEHFPIKMLECSVGISHIVNTKMPVFSTNLLDSIKTEDGADNLVFKKKLIHSYDGKDEFVDAAKEYFQGGKVERDEKSFPAHAINMTDLFNFIVSFDKIKANIEADKNTLIKGMDAIQNEMKKGVPTPKATTPTPAPAPSGNKLSPTEVATKNAERQKAGKAPLTPEQMRTGIINDSFLFGKPKTYSMVYEKYITEVETADSSKSNTASSSGASTTPANTLKQTTANNIDNNHDNSDAATKAAALAKETNDSIEAKGKIYSQLANNFLTAKMSAADFIKKEYMTIIRMHVKDYIGDDKTANGAASSETKYAALAPLSDEAKASISALIKATDEHEEGPDKEASKRVVVANVRKANPKFTGGYDEAKEYVAQEAPPKK